MAPEADLAGSILDSTCCVKLALKTGRAKSMRTLKEASEQREGRWPISLKGVVMRFRDEERKKRRRRPDLFEVEAGGD